jgi:PAS domain S-box-containing protein
MERILPAAKQLWPTGDGLSPTGDGLNDSQKHVLVEIMPSAVFTCDRDGLITYYNQRAAELWGRSPKLRDPEDRYCGSFRLYQPDGTPLPHHASPMAVAIHTGRSTRNEEIHILRPDGSSIVALANIDPLVDENGQPAGAINVFEDITRRKQAEDALRHSEERLRLAAEAGGIGIFDYDLQTRDAYFSPIYRTITKVESDPLTISEWLERVHPDDRTRVETTVATAIRDGANYHYEYRIFWPDGTLRWIEVNGLIEKDGEGRPMRLTGAMRDITDRKQVDNRLHSLYRLRREVSRTTRLEENFEHALTALEKVLYVDRAAILLTDDQGVMRFRASRGLSASYQKQVEGH